jgi:hypothetical protein
MKEPSPSPESPVRAATGESNLDARRHQVENALIGREGIHGVGVRHRDATIYIYVDDATRVKPALLREIEAAAQPYPVALVTARRPELRSTIKRLSRRPLPR